MDVAVTADDHAWGGRSILFCGRLITCLNRYEDIVNIRRASITSLSGRHWSERGDREGKGKAAHGFNPVRGQHWFTHHKVTLDLCRFWHSIFHADHNESQVLYLSNGVCCCWVLPLLKFFFVRFKGQHRPASNHVIHHRISAFSLTNPKMIRCKRYAPLPMHPLMLFMLSSHPTLCKQMTAKSMWPMGPYLLC